jgi:hypothetical protein
VLFRHPAALLQSYRRMGWTPAVAEFRRLGLFTPDAVSPDADPAEDPIGAMAWFWSACYGTVLEDLRDVPGALLVDHAELAKGGEEALRTVMGACGISAERLSDAPGTALADRLRAAGRRKEKPTLHNFARSAADVTEGWRGALSADEAARMEELTAETWSALRSRRLDLQTRTTDPALPGKGDS